MYIKKNHNKGHESTCNLFSKIHYIGLNNTLPLILYKLMQSYIKFIFC